MLRSLNTFFLTVERFEKGAYTTLSVVAVCASAGYIAGMSTLTGLALRFATAVVSLATSLKNYLNSIFSSILPFLKITSPIPFTLVFTVIAMFNFRNGNSNYWKLYHYGNYNST